MISPLQRISLKQLLKQPIMFDANIFMVGIENRVSDPNCSFDNMKTLYMIPLLESFQQIIIHEMVYKELDDDSRALVDSYKGKNITIVCENNLYGKDPEYTTIFNKISRHERVLSIPAHFEPPVRTLRAIIPPNVSQYSGARKPPFRLDGNHYKSSFILYVCTNGVNTDKGGHYHDQISRDYQAEKPELQRTKHCLKLQCFQKHRVKDL